MDFQKHAIILAVIEHLKKHGSWTGKTHVQKALFLVSAATPVNVPFEFVLYKHGPYSFDVEAELEEMLSYGAVVIETDPDGYGVVLRPGANASLIKRLVRLPGEDEQAIEQVCVFIGERRVTELEPIATAAWIRVREQIDDPQYVAQRLRDLKPHISLPEVRWADKEVVKLLGTAA